MAVNTSVTVDSLSFEIVTVDKGASVTVTDTTETEPITVIVWLTV